MRKVIGGIIFALALGACSAMGGPGAATQVSASDAHIVAALGDARRPQEERARDDARRSSEMLAFARVRSGQRVGELYPGGGYQTRLLAVAVGDAGHVYAVPSPLRRDMSQPDPIIAVAGLYPNVTVLSQPFQSMTFPEPLDMVWTSQNYHDFHLNVFHFDVAAINRAVFDALKPGGLYVIVDHSAVAGADVSVVNTLHRIDEAIVRREVEAAGFVFDGESQALRNPNDPRTALVFDPSIRGHTDQFVLRFRKPR